MMPRRIYVAYELDAPSAELFTLLTECAFQREKTLAMGAIEANCTRNEESDEAVVITADKVAPSRIGQETRKSRITTRWKRERLEGQWKQGHGGAQRTRAAHTARRGSSPWAVAATAWSSMGSSWSLFQWSGP